jgi:hypothetical protein
MCASGSLTSPVADRGVRTNRGVGIVWSPRRPESAPRPPGVNVSCPISGVSGPSCTTTSAVVNGSPSAGMNRLSHQSDIVTIVCPLWLAKGRRHRPCRQGVRVEPPPTPTAVPTTTVDPVPPTPSYVQGWATVRNSNPAVSGPLLYLSGWRFTAAFEGARVIRFQPVTRVMGDENTDPNRGTAGIPSLARAETLARPFAGPRPDLPSSARPSVGAWPGSRETY